VLGTGDERTSLQQVRSVYASAGGRAALAKLRAEGRDPAHGGDAAKRRGRATAAQTGLSEGYCSFVRRGRKVPHRRHWAALGRLSDELVLAGTG